MSKIFDLDSPIMRALSMMADLMWLNILTLVCCIPVFTAGAALTAMHYVLLKQVRGEEGYVTKTFFKGFKDNFRQSTLIWLICLVVIVIVGSDLLLLRGNQAIFPQPFSYVIAAVALLMFMIFQWIFPMQCRFVNTIKDTLRNAALMAIANFPRTILMTVVWVVPAVILFFVFAALPLVFMFGFTGPAWVCAKMYSPVFARFEPEPEEVPEESGNLDDDDPELLEAIREMQEARDNK